MRPTTAGIFKGRNGRWYFRLRSRNGKVIAASEGYSRRWGAKRGALRVAPSAKVQAEAP